MSPEIGNERTRDEGAKAGWSTDQTEILTTLESGELKLCELAWFTTLKF
jgi:hypothetical protein